MSAARDAAYFDRWYADMAAAPGRDAVVARVMGVPAEAGPTGTLPWRGLDELTGALRLRPGGVVADVACGRGGYGIEVARRTGARVVGVDFSATAVEQARVTAARRLAAGRASFVVGTLVEPGLAPGSVDAVLCVDSVQFAEPPLAALREFRRVLVPGGRVALTTWAAAEPGDERVPPRIRAVRLRRDLVAAGFGEVGVHERPEWRAAERALWEAAVALPGTDPAVESLRAEGRHSLDTFDALRRVVATATAP